MGGELVPGAVVRWKEMPGFGVVMEVEGGRISVRWDEPADRPKQFVAGGAALERANLTQRVRRRSTDQPGFLIEPVDGEGPPRWRVDFLIAKKIVPEADLRPDDALDLAGRLATGKLGTAKQYQLALVTRLYRHEHLHNDLVSLGDARVDIKPHQVGVVHRAATTYPHRFLLCDEVGLGKTIEAGMVLKELRARKQARRTLIIVPPNLIRQWQFELKTKFNEVFAILNSSTVAFLKDQGNAGNPFAHYDSVLVSSSWITGQKWAKLVTEVDWDMLIVDEAHHARLRRYGTKVQTTQLYRLVQKLAAPDHFAHRAVLFLTATPMQLESHELFSLIEMLDPALFPTEEHFERNRAEVPGLNRLVESLRQHGFPVPEEEPEDTIDQVAGWLGIDVDLAEMRLRGNSDEIESLCSDLSARHLLSEVLIRNRKAVVGGFMPRRAFRWEVQLTAQERAALNAVEDYVLTGFNRATMTSDNAAGFVMVIFQKMMASSIRALRQSLNGRRNRLIKQSGMSLTGPTAEALEERLEMDEEATTLVGSSDTTPEAEEIAQLQSLVEMLDGLKVDSKGETLIGNLADLFRDKPDEKVLIFTEFRETQNYLAERLAAQGWNVHLFHGQLDPIEKDAAADRFRVGDGPQILISTEAGGEGRNFQFCHILVNYDLPWNPMRVEQRIGRVDRIGQDHTVQIFNLWVKGTIEERILNVLERRINVFEQTVGGLDPILGDTEKDLRKILRMAEVDRDEALTRLEQQIERRVSAAREAEEKLRDLIMDTKSFRREIAEQIVGSMSPISAQDQETFITRLLADVRTYIGKSEDGERQLTFHDPFTGDYPEFFIDGRKRRAVFRADERKDNEHVEYFAFGHPIVEAVVERVLDEGYEGCTGSRRIHASDDLRPCSGWLFVYQLTIPGFRESQALIPVFVDDSGTAVPEVGEALVRRACRFDNEAGIDTDDIPFDEAEGAGEIAESFVTMRATEIEAQAVLEADARADHEREKLEEYFGYRARAAREKFDSTRMTLERLRQSDNPEQRRIIPVWEANLDRDQRLVDELSDERERRLREVEKLRSPVVDWELVSAGRIEVVEGAEEPEVGEL